LPPLFCAQMQELKSDSAVWSSIHVLVVGRRMLRCFERDDEQ